jgi:radical SAM family uncharacterized protein/radical SAM-linked protein
MFSRHHPYAEFLVNVQKPSRYTGGEYGEISKTEAAVRVCLAFPDAYEIGMSHLGTKILYSLLNRTPGIACERVFTPWIDLEAELRKRQLPLLSLESARPLCDFDIVGISLQYELNFTGILTLLELGGIPLRSHLRDESCPIILAGGPIATHGEPLAPFIDAFFIGEAEEALPKLCLEVAALRQQGIPRTEVLARCAQSFPLYVPQLYDTYRDPETGFEIVGAPKDPRVPARVKRVWVEDLQRFPFPDDSPQPHAEAVFDRMAVEIARGCTEGCRFCQAGMIYRPVRERDPIAILDALVQGIRKGGYEETSMTSLSTADYSCVTPLIRTAMARLRDEQVSLAVSSLRAYGLTEELLGDLAKSGITGLTFSPEGGTQRVRDLVNKNVTMEDVVESAHRVFSRGHKRMKLYFMIGLPGETDDDVIGIVETTAKVEAIGRTYLRSAKVTATVSTFVPKPHTPFQWVRMNSRDEIRRKHALLAEHARRLRVDLKPHENLRSQLEGIFARGDRACADLLERAYRLGCRFDGWDDQLESAKWEQAIEEEKIKNGFNPSRYLAEIPIGAKLPWSHLDMGIEEKFLQNEYRKAEAIRTSPPCGKPAGVLLHPTSVEEADTAKKSKLVCYHCGVNCNLERMKDQRLFFLRRLNAWRAPSMPPKRAPRITTPNQSPRPNPVMITSTPFRYRLRYSKLGSAVYWAHLDLVRHLPRVFRRAGFSIAHTFGFHPKPAISFGPALGLGIPSLGEILDVKIAEDIPADELLARLCKVSPPGIDFLDAIQLGHEDGSLGKILCEAHYLVRFDKMELATGALDRWRSGEPLLAARRERTDSRRADRHQRIDVRSCLRSVTLAIPDQARAQRLEWSLTDEAWLDFALRISPEGSARPVEVIEALLGIDARVGYPLARLGLGARPPKMTEGEAVDPLQVLSLRTNSPSGTQSTTQNLESLSSDLPDVIRS